MDIESYFNEYDYYLLELANNAYIEVSTVKKYAYLIVGLLRSTYGIRFNEVDLDLFNQCLRNIVDVLTYNNVDDCNLMDTIREQVSNVFESNNETNNNDNVDFVEMMFKFDMLNK